MTQVGLAWMPSLCSRLTQRRSLCGPRLPSGLTRNFGTTKSEIPLVPAGASGRRASTMCTTLVAIGDEDLLPGDAEAIAIGDGAGLERAHVRARLRLGQVHGSGPFAGDHLRQEEPLLLGRAVPLQQLDRAHVEQRTERKRHRG